MEGEGVGCVGVGGGCEEETVGWLVQQKPTVLRVVPSRHVFWRPRQAEKWLTVIVSDLHRCVTSFVAETAGRRLDNSVLTGPATS